MVLRFPPHSPRGPGFLAPVTCATRWRRCKLSASVGAPGSHGFAVRKQAALVSRAARVHRIPLNVRDDRDTPLGKAGWRDPTTFSEKRKKNIFHFGTGRPDQIEPAREIRFCAHAVVASREPPVRAAVGKIEHITCPSG